MPINDDTSIRAASPADALAAAACTRAAYAKYVPSLGGEPKPMTWDYADVLAKQQVWIAEGRVAAVVSWYLKTGKRTC